MLWEKKQESQSEERRTQITTGPDQIRSTFHPPATPHRRAVGDGEMARGRKRIEWIDQSGRETCMCMESSTMLLTYAESGRSQSESKNQ